MTVGSSAQQVRDLVYKTFAREGRAPSLAEMARHTGAEPQAVLQMLQALAEAHAIVLSPDGDAIRMAHPFTAAPMAFVVTPADGYDDRRWWGGCAWDSFGIGAALGIDVRIDTACPYCGAQITTSAGPEVPPDAELAVRFPKPASEWWNDVVATCTMIRMFCHRSHAERWTSENTADQGYIADAPTVWRLAGPWYGDRLDPGFQPHSREHNQQLLENCGLAGSFWQLP